MRFALCIAVAGLVLASCQAQERERAEAQLIAEAQAAVTEKMLDPDPVFRDVSVEDGGVAVCGTVNGMNRLGGYAGSRRFVWVKGGVAIIEDPNPGYRMRDGVRDPAACMFNAQFDECKGTPSSDSMSTCLSGF